MIKSTQQFVEWLGHYIGSIWCTQQVVEVANLPANNIDVTQQVVEVCNFPYNNIDVTQMCVEVAFGPPPPPTPVPITGSLTFSGSLGNRGFGPCADITPGPTPAATTPVPLECFHTIVSSVSDQVNVSLDWEPWLGNGDAIVTSAWTADAGVVISDEGNTDTDSWMKSSVPGAVDGSEYLLVCTITTETGKTEVRRVRLQIRTLNFMTVSESNWYRV